MKLSETFSKSFRQLYKNPILIFPPAILLILTILLSMLSVNVNYSLTNTFSITSWLVFFSLVSIVLISFFLSGLIGMSHEASKSGKKAKPIHFWKYSKKFWLKNSVILLAIILSYNIIFFLSNFLANAIGKSLGLELTPALVIFFLLQFSGLAGFLIFFTYSSFYLIIYDLSIKQSIKKSFSFVKNNYIKTFSIVLIFFVIYELLSLTDERLIFEMVNALIITPLLSLILANLVTEK